LENAAVGTFARTWCRAFKGHASSAKFFRERVEIARVNCPANNPWLGKFPEMKNERILGIRLARIRHDDFQIAPLTKRQKRILRAASRMHATKCSVYTGVLLNEINAAL